MHMINRESLSSVPDRRHWSPTLPHSRDNLRFPTVSEHGQRGRKPSERIHRPDDVAAAMFDNDAASQALGMEIISVDTDQAVVQMVVRPDMVNGLNVCHGGLIFALADSAMAFLTNSSNQYAIAAHAEIDWVNPGRLGATLTATAVTRHARGRSAVTDAEVTDDQGAIVALFRGRTRLIDGQHLPDPSDD